MRSRMMKSSLTRTEPVMDPPEAYRIDPRNTPADEVLGDLLNTGDPDFSRRLTGLVMDRLADNEAICVAAAKAKHDRREPWVPHEGHGWVSMVYEAALQLAAEMRDDGEWPAPLFDDEPARRSARWMS